MMRICHPAPTHTPHTHKHSSTEGGGVQALPLKKSEIQIYTRLASFGHSGGQTEAQTPNQTTLSLHVSSYTSNLDTHWSYN